MLAESYSPSKLSPQELDLFLANGWFRQGCVIFTTNFLRNKGLIHSAIWLRIDLLAFIPSKTHQKLNKLNINFRVEFRSFILNETHEILFAKYKTSVTFEAAISLQDLLYYQQTGSIYDTWAVNIYDQDKLIAVGIFDVGETSSMGIICFYDPDYQKYSLGKYLMFLKMQHAKNQGMTHFYPGYFSPNYPIFDYKLDLAKPFTEYLELSSHTWKSIREYSVLNTPIGVISLKLKNLQNCLAERSVETTLFNYEFFDADLISTFNGMNTFDFPVFLQCFESYGNVQQNPIIVYDVRDSQFHLVICEGIYDVTLTPNNPQHFTSQILQIAQHLFATDLAEAMAIVVETSFVVAEENFPTISSKFQF